MADSQSDDVPKQSRTRLWIQTCFLIAALLAVVLFGLLVPLPFHGRVSVAVGDLFHTPLFLVISVVVLFVVQRLWSLEFLDRKLLLRCLLVGIVIAVFGASTEILQTRFGRSGSIGDAIANCWGILAGIALHLSWLASRTQSDRIRFSRILFGFAVMFWLVGWRPATLILHDVYKRVRSFPRLSSFESNIELTRWYFRECELVRLTKQSVTDGQAALEIFPKPDANEYALTLVEMNPDWSRLKTLEFDAQVFGDGRNVEVTIRLVNQPQLEGKGPVAEVKRTLVSKQLEHIVITREQIDASTKEPIDLTDVRYLDIWFYDRRGVDRLVVDDLRLTLRMKQ